MKKALLIGVRHYEVFSSSIGEAVANDIKHMETFLPELGIEIARIVGRDTDEVDYGTIKQAIARFIVEAATDDDLIIYVSGHGYHHDGVSYIVPSEADPALPEPESYMVPVRFDAEIQKTRARSVAFLFDACRNGPAGESRTLARPGPGPVTTIVFSASAGQSARIVSGSRGMSVFTKALTETAPSLPVDARLDQAETLLRARVNQISESNGLPRQDLEIVTNVEPSAAPFPLFGTGPLVNSTDRWSRLLGRDANRHILGDCAESWSSAIEALLGIADRIDAAAPTLTADPTRTTWADLGVGERVLTALSEIVADVFPVADINRLAIVGLVTAVDAGFRTLEADLLAGLAGDASLARFESTINSDPALKAAIAEGGDERRVAALREWVVHIACPRTCVLPSNSDLRAKLGEVARVISPAGDAGGHRRLTDYLAQCVRSAFDQGQLTTELRDTYEADTRTGFLVEGRRIAACLRLAWLLGLDSRLFPSEAGLHLVYEDIPTTEALAGLERTRWVRAGTVLDLSLVTRSAALDRTLRSMCTQLTDVMLAEKQVGAPFQRLQTPVVATASRLQPEDESYRLPHVTFQVSVSEIQALLMGTNLYGDENLAIRELYQNALDACNYRMQRYTYAAGGAEEIGWAPKIIFRTGANERGPYLECQDNGIGMSHYELRESFAKAGKRLRDLPEYTEEMAQWRATGSVDFHPISQFGIGVFSYFMLADELELWTTRTSENARQFEPLHVQVKGGGGLFHVRPADRATPPGGGTLVRLYLRPSSTALNLLDVLRTIVRAPSVDTVLLAEDGTHHQWSAGHLYSSTGGEVPGSRRMTDNVYFHLGMGELLLNGIPIQSGAPGYFGITISIDGRARPDLTVDRRTLREYDRGHVLDALRSAVERVADWDQVSGEWIAGLFGEDLRVGVAAYRACRDKEIRLLGRREPIGSEGEWTGPTSGNTSLAAQVPDVRIVPDRDGIHPQDDFLAIGAEGSRFNERVLSAARRRDLADLLSGRPMGHKLKGVPRYDERLLALLTLGGAWNSAALIDFAAALSVGLGSACGYAWAVAFLETPVPLWLATKHAQLTTRSSEWSSLRASGEGVPLLSRSKQIMASLVQWVSDDLIVDGRYPTQAYPLFGDDQAERAVRPHEPIVQDGFPTADGEDGLPGDLSDAGLIALSNDRDGEAPYLTKNVPAFNVAHAAAIENADVRDVLAELARANRAVLPADVDWAALTSVARRFPFLPELAEIEAGGLLEMPEDLDDVLEFYEMVSPDKLRGLFRDLARSGVITESQAKLGEVDWPRRKELKVHAAAVTAEFGDAVGWRHVVALSAECEGTLGEALGILARYAPLFPGSELPADLPAELRDRVTTAVERSYFLDTAWDTVRLTATSWALRAIRQSAVSGERLAVIAESVSPLLDVMGEDSSLLQTVAQTCPGAVEFDDLVVLGAGQIVGASATPELVRALCLPFVSEPNSVAQRIARWAPYADDLQMRATTWPLLELAEG